MPPLADTGERDGKSSIYDVSDVLEELEGLEKHFSPGAEENEEVQALLESVHRLRDSLRETTNALKSSEGANEDLLVKYRDLESQKDSVEAAKNQLEEALAELERRLETTRARAADERTQLQMFKTQNETLIAQNRRQQVDLTQATEALAANAAQIEILGRQISQLQDAAEGGAAVVEKVGIAIRKLRPLLRNLKVCPNCSRVFTHPPAFSSHAKSCATSPLRDHHQQQQEEESHQAEEELDGDDDVEEKEHTRQQIVLRKPSAPVQPREAPSPKQRPDQAWMNSAIVYNLTTSEWRAKSCAPRYVTRRLDCEGGLPPTNLESWQATEIRKELKHVKTAFVAAAKLLFHAQHKFKISSSTEFATIETIVTGLYRYLRFHIQMTTLSAGEIRTEFCLGGSIAATYASRDQHGNSNEIVMVLCPQRDFVDQSRKGDTCRRHCQLELQGVAVLGSMQKRLTLSKCTSNGCCFTRRPFCCPPLIPSQCRTTVDRPAAMVTAAQKKDPGEAPDALQPLARIAPPAEQRDVLLPLSKVVLSAHRLGSLTAAQKQQVDCELVELVHALEPAAALACQAQLATARVPAQDLEQVAARVIEAYARVDPKWMENDEVTQHLSLLIRVPAFKLAPAAAAAALAAAPAPEADPSPAPDRMLAAPPKQLQSEPRCSWRSQQHSARSAAYAVHGSTAPPPAQPLVQLQALQTPALPSSTGSDDVEDLGVL